MSMFRRHAIVAPNVICSLLPQRDLNESIDVNRRPTYIGDVLHTVKLNEDHSFCHLNNSSMEIVQDSPRNPAVSATEIRQSCTDVRNTHLGHIYDALKLED